MEYQSGIVKAKEMILIQWKMQAEDDSVTESEFNAQLNLAADRGQAQKGDHSLVRIFLKMHFNTLNEAWVRAENRLNAVQKKIEAALHAVEDENLSKLQAIVPTYSRVVQGDEEYENLLKINKFLEHVLVQQMKLTSELTQRIVALETKLECKMDNLFEELVTKPAVAAAAEKEKEKERQAKSLAGRTKQLTFSSIGDTNGLFYHLGTKGGTTSYANPHTAGTIVASASSRGQGMDAEIVSRDQPANGYCFTNSVANSWMKVDIGAGRFLLPNYYSFKTDGNSYGCRNWRLEGCNDNTNWVSLKEHIGDTTIATSAHAPGSWPINITASSTSSNPNGFRYFRVFQTGPNSHNDNHLMLCCLELYGKYIRDGNVSF